jgi:hypothetical protein
MFDIRTAVFKIMHACDEYAMAMYGFMHIERGMHVVGVCSVRVYELCNTQLVCVCVYVYVYAMLFINV